MLECRNNVDFYNLNLYPANDTLVLEALLCIPDNFLYMNSCHMRIKTIVPLSLILISFSGLISLLNIT